MSSDPPVSSRIRPSHMLRLRINFETMNLLWDLRFSRWRIWSRARLTHHSNDGGRKHLWNVGKYLPDCMAQQPIRNSFLYDYLYIQYDCLYGGSATAQDITEKRGHVRLYLKRDLYFIFFLPCQHLDIYEHVQNRFTRPYQHWPGLF
jgi:hypothetical protein